MPAISSEVPIGKRMKGAEIFPRSFLQVDLVWRWSVLATAVVTSAPGLTLTARRDHLLPRLQSFFDHRTPVDGLA